MNELLKTFLWIKGILLAIPLLGLTFYWIITIFPLITITPAGRIVLSIATLITLNLFIARLYNYMENIKYDANDNFPPLVMTIICEIFAIMISLIWIRNML